MKILHTATKTHYSKKKKIKHFWWFWSPQYPIAGQERLAVSYWEQGSLLCFLLKGQKEFSPALHLPGMSFKRKKEEVKNKH